MNQAIDFAGIAERANLRGLIEAELGPANSSRKWACPFHDDHKPSLSLTPDGRRFRCWSAGCGASGTALDWTMLRDDVTIVEAARRLDPGYQDPGRPPRPKPAPRPDPPPTWRDPEWQAAVDAIIRQAEEVFWSPEGKDARRWLRWRGLHDSTIRRFRLGFVPEPIRSDPIAALAREDGRPRSIRAGRGILLPWIAPGEVYDPDELAEGGRWVGANVRHLADDVFGLLPPDQDKCRALLGSSRGYGYPWGDLLPSQIGPPALIVEGELDALIGVQELGHLIHVTTVGGAGQTPRPAAVAMLGKCPAWLLSLDHDAAGRAGVEGWRARDPARCRRVMLPTKDLGAFVQDGGDARAWLYGEAERLGIDLGLRHRPNAKEARDAA